MWTQTRLLDTTNSHSEYAPLTSYEQVPWTGYVRHEEQQKSTPGAREKYCLWTLYKSHMGISARTEWYYGGSESTHFGHALQIPSGDICMQRSGPVTIAGIVHEIALARFTWRNIKLVVDKKLRSFRNFDDCSCFQKIFRRHTRDVHAILHNEKAWNRRGHRS